MSDLRIIIASLFLVGVNCLKRSLKLFNYNR